MGLPVSRKNHLDKIVPVLVLFEPQRNQVAPGAAKDRPEQIRLDSYCLGKFGAGARVKARDGGAVFRHFGKRRLRRLWVLRGGRLRLHGPALGRGSLFLRLVPGPLQGSKANPDSYTEHYCQYRVSFHCLSSLLFLVFHKNLF
jgi:hypothetical protein